MKNYFLSIVLLVGLLVSCIDKQPDTGYVYNLNPTYSWGYVEFYGAYYADFGNDNNVISLSLFSDSLKINDIGTLVGIGQYLFLEDIFINKTDTLLPNGTYTISNNGLPFTVAPGVNDTVDGAVYPIGACISYYEPITSQSTIKLITGGSFTSNRMGNTYTISCNFTTDDKLTLKGSFSATLPYIDQSISTSKSSVRKKINQNFSAPKFRKLKK
jgi:hypothetical protein